MTAPLRAAGATLAMALLLGACATPAPEPAATTTAQAQPKQKKSEEDRETITGSRLPSKTTDRMIHRVGSAGAREMERDRAPDPGPQSR